MSMTGFKLSKSLLALMPLVRARPAPAGRGLSGSPEYNVNLDELPTHMLRDIGVLDGHATPERHAARRARRPFS